MPGSGDFKPRQRRYGIGEHDPTVIDHFLELGCGLDALALREKCFAAHVCRVHGAVETIVAQSVYGGFITLGRFEFLFGLFQRPVLSAASA